MGLGSISKTMNQLMAELVEDSSILPAEQEGHRWYHAG